jgi:predicted ribosomally synthesized peptide with SipW-like signal peptide
VCAGGVLLVAAATLALFTDATQANGRASAKVPQFQVDSTWPKPFPTSPDPVTGRPRVWIPGEVAGTCVDARDNVFIVTRGNLIAPEEVKGVAAPPVMQFDPEGNTVAGWGDRNVLPNGIHGCFVDYQDNLWIAGNGDGIVQKYSHSGQLLLQIGTRGVCDNPPANTCGNSGANPLANQSKTLLNQPADIFVDPNPDPVTGQRGSVYIADGYGNHRIVVFSANGTWLRQWGGVAGTVNNPLTDFPALFGAGDGGHPHCVLIGNDGMVYVCDRQNDRIQVFTKTGNFVRVMAVVPGTGATRQPGGQPGLGTAGSAWDLDFSVDPGQSIMFEADGGNEQVLLMDRHLGTILSKFGQPGRQGAQFTFLHTVSIDSKGNLYTGETINGRRIQKFVPTGCKEGRGKGNGRGRCDD